MAEPTNADEYLTRFAENQRVEGTGIDVAQVLPCPWCAAADFKTLKPAQGIIDDGPDIDKQMATASTCGECGRTGQSIVKRTAEGVSFEFVQTDGPDAPEWLVPAPRRV